MGNKQLYEKQSNQYNPFFPIVRLEDIIETISDKSIQWILNNYNHIYVEYSESVAITRNKVPSLLRRNGLWISYNTGKDIVTEWYKGKNVNINDYNQWTDDANWAKFEPLADGKVTYQHLSHALKQLMGKGNTITNFPDEEDITTDGTVLSFKDREYDINNFSGLGRIILRKNIVLDDRVYKNILTQNMINKSNTIYEIRYDFDLNGQNIEIPENCMLDFQGGNITNGVLFSDKTRVMNIPKGLYILGRIFNSAGQEITTRGDVIKRNTKLVFAFNVLTSSKFDYLYDKYGISTKVKGLYDVGVTECYVDITLVKSTSSNGSVTITPNSEYISDESFIKYLKSQGIFHDIQALRFNISNDLNTEEAPNNIMPSFNSCVLKTLKSLKDKGLKFESVYIANEREDWINPDNSHYKPEYVNYLIDLANSIRELGYIPVINSANFYLLQNVDSRLYDYVEPTYNFYPNISFSDEKTVYSPELSNSVKEQFDFRVPVWNGKYKTSTIGICESGTNSRKKALRFPGQSDLAELGDPWYNAKVVFHEIVADIINYYSIPYYGIWYTESFTNDVDKDKLYNIFVNKIK